MKYDKKISNALEENIRKIGAMDQLVSYSARSDISHRDKDTLRALFIDDWQSNPCYQHQHFT